MGQENNKAGRAPLTDILGREMEVYRWRSDPNFNEYVSRVSFKSAFAQHQEDLYTEFLRLQEGKEYLEIYKFKEQLQKIPDTKDQQVVIFETYHCSLADLHKQLSFEECLYLFYALLSGYEQIKKIFDKIVIDSACCFVTKEGAVRAWINPNPRSNQQWLGMFRELRTQSSQTQIVLRILKVAEATLRTSKRGQIFFAQLYSLFKTQIFKNCSFSQLRRWINQYCYMHRIQMAKNINMEARNKSCLPSSLKESKLSVREERKTEFKEYRLNNKENNAFLETRHSEADQNVDQKITLAKSKSADKTNFGWVDFAPDQTSQSNRRQSIGITLNHCNSQVFANKNSQRCSTMMEKPHLKEEPKLSQIKESTLICSQIQKSSEIFKNKAIDIPNVKSSMIQLEKRSKVSLGYKMSEKEVQVSLHPSEHKMASIIKNNVERVPKSTMQVSIINAIPQEQKDDSFRHKTSKYRTVYSPKQSIECINESDIFSRPWITTKTITKLVSENQNGSSLENSIAESSEYYNTSNYSGALTQMGRDITLKEDTGNGRSRTVRVSRQV